MGSARRAVHEYAARQGFGEKALAEIDIVVQEIGTNAAGHATAGGWLHFTTPSGPAPGLELFYWDQGPGIYNLDRATLDGFSTGGTLGSGLGAMARLTDEFDIYSTVRTTTRLTLTQQRRTTHGTAILARKWLAAGGALRDAPAGFWPKRTGAWSRPRPGEHANGDAYYAGERDGRALFAVVDGLGHGTGARQASEAALASLEDWRGESLDEVILAAHDALRATRGAVMGVLMIDEEAGRFHYAGVGNIAARVFNSPEHASPTSINGTLGLRLGKVRVWTHPWAAGTTFVMASDGLSASWDINSYPGLLSRSPQLLAGVLMRDYGRDSDDATVLVVR